MTMEGAGLNPQEDVSKQETPLERIAKAKEAEAVKKAAEEAAKKEEAEKTIMFQELAKTIGDVARLEELTRYAEAHPDSDSALSKGITAVLNNIERLWDNNEYITDKGPKMMKPSTKEISENYNKYYRGHVGDLYDQLMQEKAKEEMKKQE